MQGPGNDLRDTTVHTCSSAKCLRLLYLAIHYCRLTAIETQQCVAVNQRNLGSVAADSRRVAVCINTLGHSRHLTIVVGGMVRQPARVGRE